MKANYKDSASRTTTDLQLRWFFRISAHYFGLQVCPAVFNEALQRIRNRKHSAKLNHSTPLPGSVLLDQRCQEFAD